jgi:hypothetical protein
VPFAADFCILTRGIFLLDVQARRAKTTLSYPQQNASRFVVLTRLALLRRDIDHLEPFTDEEHPVVKTNLLREKFGGFESVCQSFGATGPRSGRGRKRRDCGASSRMATTSGID